MADRAGTGAPAELCRTVYPELVREARAIARQHGYAIGVHGSLLYDLDLMAMPWSDECSPENDLANALLKLSGCLHRDAGDLMPGGRISYTLTFHDRLHIDLSIMPPQTQEPEKD